MIYKTYTIGGYLCHHGIDGQKWGVKNGPPYPLSRDVSTGKKLKKRLAGKNKKFDPFEAMNKIDRSLSKKERDLLGVGNDHSTNDIKFFFNKDKTAYLITADYHGKYKDEHPVSGKIIGIAAEKKARGTGATDKLITDAKKYFKNDRLVAEIDKGNIASRKLFERNGFTKVKEADGVDYYTWENKKKQKRYSDDTLRQLMRDMERQRILNNQYQQMMNMQNAQQFNQMAAQNSLAALNYTMNTGMMYHPY